MGCGVRELRGCSSRVSSIIGNRHISCLPTILELIQNVGLSINDMKMVEEDTLIWLRDVKKDFSTALAFEAIRSEGIRVHWHGAIWNRFTHPKLAANAWKLHSGRAATDLAVKKKGIHLVPKCKLCGLQEEDLNHLLWQCTFAEKTWNWLAGKFKFRAGFSNNKEAMSRSQQVKIITDGTTKGSYFRDHDGNFLLICGKGLGEATSYWAECICILESVEIAIEKGWLNMWVESDAVTTFTSNSMSWQIRYIWHTCMKRPHLFYLSHIWREGNTVADAIAKNASNLEKDLLIVCNVKPPWIYKWEVPYQTFMRFV
ncbi:hypothetical protein IFM89_014654 [Coptis chinensis]|uniref:Uncharacterized protein n=1 Tax=Coptis chinensis TaxID=261450 RepID=A0A835LEC5_9MAGN|nr:hypothetical protein IFM89_014654 [Coptis chinensis]